MNIRETYHTEHAPAYIMSEALRRGAIVRQTSPTSVDVDFMEGLVLDIRCHVCESDIRAPIMTHPWTHNAAADMAWVISHRASMQSAILGGAA